MSLGGDTIQDLKAYIEKVEYVPIDRLHLTFEGVDLEDEKTLADYDVRPESVLDLSIYVRGGEMQILVTGIDGKNEIINGSQMRLSKPLRLKSKPRRKYLLIRKIA